MTKAISRELVRAAAAGDGLAFGRLVDSTKAAVTSIALAVVRDVPSSEDVAQEVFVQAWRDLGTLKNEDSFLPWIRQLTRHKALTFVRSRRRYEHHRFAAGAERAEAGTVPRALREEEAQVLAEAIGALPDETREIVTLFYREEQSVQQVASLLEMSESAVKKRLERARAALKVDVLERFGEAAKKSTPAAGFTAGVLAALTIGAPSTAAAATVAGSTMAKTGMAAVLTAIVAPLVGFLGGAGGLYFGMNRYLRDAIDDDERRALVRYRNKGVVVTAGLAFGTLLLTRALGMLHVGRTWGGLVVIAYVAFLTMTLFRMSLTELPAILMRRRELERLRDPEAYERRRMRETRGRLLGIVLGGAGAAIGFAVAAYVVFAGILAHR